MRCAIALQSLHAAVEPALAIGRDAMLCAGLSVLQESLLAVTACDVTHADVIPVARLTFALRHWRAAGNCRDGKQYDEAGEARISRDHEKPPVEFYCAATSTSSFMPSCRCRR